jgi:hypothetical protein
MSRGNVSSVDELAAIIAEQDARIAGLERTTHRHPVGGVGDRWVDVTGDTMTGGLTFTGTAGITFSGTNQPFLTANLDGSWMGFYSAGGGARRGYLQGNSNGLLLNSEAGNLTLMTNTTVTGTLTISGHTLTGNDSWLRPSGYVYVGLGVLGVGPNGLNVNNGGAQTAGYMIDCNGSLRVNGNIGFSPANPTLSASSYTIFPGGLYVSGGILYVAGTHNARGGISNDTGTGAPGVCIFASGASYTSGWQYNQLQVRETSGAQHTAISMLTGPTAPMMRAYGPFGERMDFLNNPNTAYIPICASQFAVTSTERIKHDIREVADAELLDLVGDVRTHNYVANTRPMTKPVTERFLDLNRRWLARGRRPLTPTAPCYEDLSEPHDCANERHWCFGAPGHPCPIARNDTPRYGLIAEHLAAHVSEVVWYDEAELPAGYDIDQVAAMAFGGVGALLRKVEALQARVDELEQDRFQPLLRGVAA